MNTYRSGNGKFQSRAKTYTKRAGVGLLGVGSLGGLGTLTRRGRRLTGKYGGRLGARLNKLTKGARRGVISGLFHLGQKGKVGGVRAIGAINRTKYGPKVMTRLMSTRIGRRLIRALI